MMVRRTLFAIGLAVAAGAMLVPAAEAAQGKSSVYLRMSQLHSGSAAGASSPAVRGRFFPGMVSRFSAGGRTLPGRHSINDVTMKRGVVGGTNQPDLPRVPR
jgi:hypothetical protein